MKIEISNHEICGCALSVTNSFCTESSVEMERMMSIRELFDKIKQPCRKCPYRTGLVETPFNPCPQCRLNGYQTYERFKKQSMGDSTIDERRS